MNKKYVELSNVPEYYFMKSLCNLDLSYIINLTSFSETIKMHTVNNNG